MYILTVHRNRFEFQNIIGKGGFGKVWKVIDKKHKIAYALKEMSKVKVIDKKSEKSIKYERELLSHLKNPFIVNMYYAFQDYEHLYLVMDLLTGGDLRYHICKHRLFSEAQTKFFIACIIQGLEYIHSKKVIHRDIKPENLVLDENGYIRITDFGIAKIFNNKNSHETSGTPGYMAPEVMKAQNHTKAVDYFAVGVIAYELMMGKRPYSGKGRKEIKEQMMGKQACIKREEMPDFWSEDAMNFINMLLMRKPEKRLGFKSIDEIKTHPWLKTFPWKSLYDKKITSPYVPDKKENYDKKYCTAIEKEDLDVKTRYEQYRSNKNYTSIFLNFTYYPMIDNWNSDYNYNSVNSSNYHVNNGVIHGNKNAGSRNANATLTTYYNRRCQSASSNAIYHNNNAKLNASNNNFRQQRVFSPKNASSSLQNKGLFQGNNNNNSNSNGPTKPVEPGMRKYNTKNYFSTTSKGLNIKNSNSININKESTIVNNNGDNANTSNDNNNTIKGKSKLILNPNHLNQYNCKSFIQHNTNSRTGVLTPTTKRNFDKINTNNSIGKNHHSLQNQSNNIHSEANNKRKNSHSKTKEKFGLSSVLKQIRSTSQHNHNDNNINNSTNNNNLSSNSSTILKSKQLVKTLTNKNKTSSSSTTATGTTVNKRSIIGFAIQKIEHSSVKSPNKKQTLTSPTNNNTSHPKIKEDSERSAITMKSHMHKNSSCSTGNSSIGIIPNNNNTTTTNKHNQQQQPIHSSSNFKNISHNNDILIINDK